MNNLFKQITIRNVGIAFVGSILMIQIASLFLSSIFPQLELIKAGPAILLMLLAIALITLLIVGLKVDSLNKRENLIFIVIVFGLVGAGYYYLPKYFPSIFSISPISDVVKSTVGSIIGAFG